MTLQSGGRIQALKTLREQRGLPWLARQPDR